MFERPPREKAWVSWLVVVLWSGFLFAVVPFARSIQAFVGEYFEQTIFTYIVVATVVAVCALSIIYLRRHSARVGRNTFWLLLFGGFFVAYTFNLRRSPSEALHFIEYGVLGFLLFRALSHHLRDQGIYIAAVLIGAAIGTLDEAIQWITPGRFWGLGDIWINFVAVFLVQGAIALGFRPAIIERRLGPDGIRLSCRLAILVLVLLGASALNTPTRIAWYAENVPGLGFLKQNQSVMLEYGFLYEDPEIGVFRSRLTPEALARSDSERAQEGAEILSRYQDPESYSDYLDIYSPVSDPFLHEVRVHLFRRDRHIERAQEVADEDPALFQKYMSIAYRENQILEKYFSDVVKGSPFAWSEETKASVREHLLPDFFYDSWVSHHLVTSVNETGILLFLAVAIAGLVVVGRIYGRSKS